MKNIVAILLLSVIITACSTTYSYLYNWGSRQNGVTEYEHLAYRNYDKTTPETICKLIVLYDKLISNPGGQRNLPPPGICAEYGYLLLQPEVMQTFLDNATPGQLSIFQGENIPSFFKEYGQRMFQKEIEYYPESAVFIGPLLKKLSSR